MKTCNNPFRKVECKYVGNHSYKTAIITSPKYVATGKNWKSSPWLDGKCTIPKMNVGESKRLAWIAQMSFRLEANLDMETGFVTKRKHSI